MLFILFLLISTFSSYSAELSRRVNDFITAREYYQAQLQQTMAATAALQTIQHMTQAEMDALCDGIDFGAHEDDDAKLEKPKNNSVELTQAEIDELCHGIDFGADF